MSKLRKSIRRSKSTEKEKDKGSTENPPAANPPVADMDITAAPRSSIKKKAPRGSVTEKPPAAPAPAAATTSAPPKPKKTVKIAPSALDKGGSLHSKGSSMHKRKKHVKPSKWEESLQVIDELLVVDSATYKAMTPRQRKVLGNMKGILATLGMSDLNNLGSNASMGYTSSFIPRDLILAQKREQKRRQKALQSYCNIQVFPSNAPRGPPPRAKVDPRMLNKRASSHYILQEYAGVKESDPLLADKGEDTKQGEDDAKGPKRLTRRPLPQPSVRLSMEASTDDGLYTPREFQALPKESQQRLCELLSWENLGQWGFDIFELNQLTDGNPLLFMGWAVIGSPYAQRAMKQASWKVLEDDVDVGYPFMDDYNIPPHKLCNYLRVIENDYHADNPYHNNIHAADVVQGLHCFIQMALRSENGVSFLKTCPTIHLFAALLSAVIHDVDHPGKNNAFQTKVKTELAVVYNDASVLENWHVAMAFARLLDKPLLNKSDIHDLTRALEAGEKKKDVVEDAVECNILSNVSGPDFDQIRNLMIQAVLHTDMSKHFAQVDSARGMILQAQQAEDDGDADANTDENADLAWNALMFMLHMADISNQAKPGALAREWTDRCMNEFFAQGDIESKMGIPISPLCDRSVTEIPESQVGFIKFVVLPAYQALGDLIPGVKAEVLPLVQDNLDYWTREKGSTAEDENTEDDMSDDDDDDEMSYD